MTHTRGEVDIAGTFYGYLTSTAADIENVFCIQVVRGAIGDDLNRA